MILGLASSPVILLTTSLILFLLLTLLAGQALLSLLSSTWFDVYIRRPLDAVQTQIERQAEEELGGGVWTYGVGYGSATGGLLELVVKSVNVFASGEAEEVVVASLHKLADSVGGDAVVPPSSTWFGRGVSFFPTSIPSFLRPVLTRIFLGFSLIGSLSFTSLIISSSLIAPFQLANNFRFGRGWTRRRGAGGAPAGGVGLGTGLLVLAVCMGAIRFVCWVLNCVTSLPGD